MEVPQDPKKEIVHIWGQHYQEVTKTLLSQTINTNSLVDVDWSFGVTSASDTCDQVGRSLISFLSLNSMLLFYLICFQPLILTSTMHDYRLDEHFYS